MPMSQGSNVDINWHFDKRASSSNSKSTGYQEQHSLVLLIQPAWAQEIPHWPGCQGTCLVKSPSVALFGHKSDHGSQTTLFLAAGTDYSYTLFYLHMYFRSSCIQILCYIKYFLKRKQFSLPSEGFLQSICYESKKCYF